MGRTRVIWSAEKYQRLLAATIAAHPGMKLNYHAIAAIFGEGATYDTIETRFRIVRTIGKQLAAEVANGERPAEATPTPRKRRANGGDANPSPTKKKGSTVVGRQSTGAGYLFTPPPFTPPKRNVNVKSEMLDRELWSAASDEDETELEEEQEVIGFSF